MPIPLTLDASQRHAIHRLSSDQIALHDSRSIVIVDVLDRKERQIIATGNSIGSIATSDNGDLIAVGEKCVDTFPKLVIYESNSENDFNKVVSLDQGAVRKYDCMDFDKDGRLLATVSGHPDYILTIWNWRSGVVILRCKAFSQDVLTVKFSRIDPKQLMTSGTGHIRFWTMADTFTGMKLQGSLGKFGKVELMDILDFAELKHGHVLSGTDTGELLLWKECMIKGVIRCPGNKKCHKGAVNYVCIDWDRRHAITASSDGFIKVWDADGLVSLEELGDDNVVIFEASPLFRVCLNECDGAEKGRMYQVISLVWQSGWWIVALMSGGIFRITAPNCAADVKTIEMKTVWDYSAGGIASVELFNKGNCFVAASGDGTLSLYDLKLCRLMYKSIPFSSGATCTALMPIELEPESRHCIVGFADGTVRVVKRCLNGWKLISVMKPHKAAVSFVAVSEARVVTGCLTGRLFFFSVSECTLHPLGMTTLHEGLDNGTGASLSISTGCFADEGRCLYIGTKEGRLFRVSAPQTPPEIRQLSDAGYKLDCSISQVDLGGTQTTEAQAPILSLLPLPGRGVLITFGDPLIGMVYLLNTETSLCAPLLKVDTDSPITCMKFNSDRLLLGTANGKVVIKAAESTQGNNLWTTEAQCDVHDVEKGSISGLCLLPNRQLISAATDGTLLVSNLNKDRNREQLSSAVEQLPLVSQDPVPAVDDIIGDDTFTIDEAQTKEAEKLAAECAVQKKRRVRSYIQDLRDQLQQLKEANDARPEHQRIGPSYFLVDENLREKMQNELEQKMNAAKKEFEFELEKECIALKKLQNKFFTRTEQFSETLSGIDASLKVTSFKIDALDPALEKRMHELQKDMQTANAGQRQESKEDEKATTIICEPEKEAITNACDAVSTKAAGRSESRKRRAELIKKHELKKPKDGEENQVDVEAIQIARDTIGEFKLKTEPEHLLPKQLRESPARKEFEILEIDVGIHKTKSEFNLKFSALKRSREELMEEILQCDQDLLHLQQKITNSGDHLLAVSFSSENLVKDKDCEMKLLADRVKEVLQMADTFKTTSEIPNKEQACEKQPSVSKEGRQLLNEKASKLMFMYTFDRLMQRRASIIAAFDKKLHQLCLEKLDIECNLKYATMMKIVKQQELECLKGFQQMEDTIDDKITTKLQEKQNVQTSIALCQKQLEDKTSSDPFSSLKSDVLKKFNQIVSQSPIHSEFLTKVLNKRTETSGPDAPGSESDTDESMSEGSTAEGVPDEYPEGLDRGLFNAVCKLRDESIQLEENHAQLMKEAEAIKKEKEMHSRKLKAIELSLSALQSEMRQCQQQKQMQLNEISSAVVLKPSQIETQLTDAQCLKSQAVVVICKDAIESLEGRPKELEKEWLELRQGHQSLKHDFIRLKQTKQVMGTNLENLEKRLEDMQMLKFGQVIDQDALDEAQANHSKSQISKTQSDKEVELMAEIAQIDLEIKKEEQALLLQTVENTDKLNKLSEHKLKSLEIEKNQSKHCEDASVSTVSQVERENARARLIKEVKEQAKKIFELKDSIQRFKRKDTTIYA